MTMIFNTTLDYIQRGFGSEGIQFIEEYNIVSNDIEKRLFLMKGEMNDKDQIFYYKDSTNCVIGFNIAYLHNIPTENKFYENVILNIKGNNVYKDDCQVNFDYCENNFEFDNKDETHPIYIIEYFDNEYYYLVVDGNHRISNMVDNGKEKINVRLLDTMATILMIYDPKEIFTYAILNIYRLLNMQNSNQEEIKNKISLIIKVVNYCYINRYKKFYNHII